MEVKPGYKWTEVGALPEDWEAGPIGRAIEGFESGASVNSEKGGPAEFDSYPCVLKTGAAKGGVVDPAESKKVARRDLRRLKVSLRESTILVSRMNTAELVGESGFVDANYPNVFVPDRMWMITVRSDGTVWPRYLSNVLISQPVKSQISASATGTSGSMKNISKPSFRAVLIPYPPPAEQRAIATALSDVDALLSALDRLIAKKRNLKQAAMQQLLTGQTRLPGFRGQWRQTELKEEARLITKGATPTSYGRGFVEHGVNFFKAESFAEDGSLLENMVTHIDDSTHSFMRRSQLADGDILFSIAGALGRTTRVRREWLPANTNQALALVRLRKNSVLDGEYLGRFLASSAIQSRITAISVQAAQPNLSLADVGSFVISHPDLPEQAAIAAVLTDMDAELATLEQRRDKTSALKQAMMQELLTGRTRLV